MSVRWQACVATAGMRHAVGVMDGSGQCAVVEGREPDESDRSVLLSREWLRCGLYGQVMIRSSDVAVVHWEQA